MLRRRDPHRAVVEAHLLAGHRIGPDRADGDDRQRHQCGQGRHPPAIMMRCLVCHDAFLSDCVSRRGYGWSAQTAAGFADMRRSLRTMLTRMHVRVSVTSWSTTDRSATMPAFACGCAVPPSIGAHAYRSPSRGSGLIQVNVTVLP